jgi:hypothetical protein
MKDALVLKILTKKENIAKKAVFLTTCAKFVSKNTTIQCRKTLLLILSILETVSGKCIINKK